MVVKNTGVSLTLVATGSDYYFGEGPQVSLKAIGMVKTIVDLVQRSAPTDRY